MSDYKSMYRQLFQEVTKAIAILQDAQLQTEQMYMSADNPVLSLVARERDAKEG